MGLGATSCGCFESIDAVEARGRQGFAACGGMRAGLELQRQRLGGVHVGEHDPDLAVTATWAATLSKRGSSVSASLKGWPSCWLLSSLASWKGT